MPAANHRYDRDEPHTGLFHAYLEHWAATTPESVAYRYEPLGLVNAESETATWAELNREASQLAATLADDGVESGDAIATLFPPSGPFAAVYFAAAKLGAMLVPLDLRGTPADHQYVLEATSPTAFVGAGQYRETDFRAVLERVDAYSEIETTHWLEDGYREALTEGDSYERTVVGADGEVLSDENVGCSDPETPLLVVFTSGTTGDPKGAVLTHRNVVFQGTAISSTWGVEPDDTALVHLPMDHVGGATELVGSATVAGSTSVFLDAFDPGVALSLIETHGISMVGNVPAMWGMLFNHERYEEADLSTLRLAIVAGQAPSEDILRGMLDCADIAATGWGLTETGGFVTLTDPDASLSELTSTVGTPFPGFEVRPVDDDGAFLPTSQTGELVVRGDGVMQRFLADEHDSGAFVDDEWVRTGDLGLVGDDRRVRLHGRAKNMFISGGYNVYPPEVEDALTDHPAVDQAMVIGVTDDEWGESGHAFVLTAPDSDLDTGSLEAFVDERLADYKQPVTYTVASTLPMTSLGKIDRQAIIGEYDLDAV